MRCQNGRHNSVINDSCNHSNLEWGSLMRDSDARTRQRRHSSERVCASCRTCVSLHRFTVRRQHFVCFQRAYQECSATHIYQITCVGCRLPPPSSSSPTLSHNANICTMCQGHTRSHQPVFNILFLKYKVYYTMLARDTDSAVPKRSVRIARSGNVAHVYKSVCPCLQNVARATVQRTR